MTDNQCCSKCSKELNADEIEANAEVKTLMPDMSLPNICNDCLDIMVGIKELS